MASSPVLSIRPRTGGSRPHSYRERSTADILQDYQRAAKRNILPAEGNCPPDYDFINHTGLTDYASFAFNVRISLMPTSLRHRQKLRLACAAAGLLALATEPHAATTTTTFTVQMTITASCTIVSASTLNFGSQGVLTANVDQTSTLPLQVQCTNTTPYNIGLNAGTGSAATVAVRKMTSGGATINYSLYT